MATLRQPRHHIHNIFLNNFGLSPSENKIRPIHILVLSI